RDRAARIGVADGVDGPAGAEREDLLDAAAEAAPALPGKAGLGLRSEDAAEDAAEFAGRGRAAELVVLEIVGHHVVVDHHDLVALLLVEEAELLEDHVGLAPRP